MVLLAYDDIKKSPYKELGTEDQLKKLASIINLEILSAQMESTGIYRYLINTNIDLFRNNTSLFIKITQMVTNPT
jgi:hypothetical protein